MKKFLLLTVVLFAVSATARAQNDYPKFEVYGGYSYFSADVRFSDPFDNTGQSFFSQREGSHGVGWSVADNFTRHLGVVADFSYHKRSLDVPFTDDIDLTTFSFLFGPRVTARGHRVEAFAHALVGGVRRKVEDIDSTTSLAFGLGGGVDVKVAKSFAVRVLQVDYLPFRDTDFFTGDHIWRQNVRAGAGVTFRF